MNLPAGHPPVVAPRVGVLLVNLGTPDAPTTKAVRRYLKEFLSDPRVVEIPKPIWWLILNGVILNVRPRKSAHAYAQVWGADGSPLATITKGQADGLQARLGQGIMVRWAMRYGNPAMGMVLAEMVNRVRSDFKILTRSLLTGIPEVEQFMIPVPFPHEDNARELGLQMRDETMKHLKAGGVIILFPAGKVAMSEGWWGPAVEGEWNVFTHKIVKSSGATILPVYFPGQNSRAFQIANQLSDTLRQGLLLYEIKRCLFKPVRPVIGAPIPAEELKKWEGNPRGFLAWLREHTLALKT